MNFHSIFLLISVTTSEKKHSLRTTQTEAENSLNSTIKAEDIDFFHLNTAESLEKRIQLRQRRGPCSCSNLNCGCCAGMAMQQFNIKRIRKYAHL